MIWRNIVNVLFCVAPDTFAVGTVTNPILYGRLQFRNDWTCFPADGLNWGNKRRVLLGGMLGEYKW